MVRVGEGEGKDGEGKGGRVREIGEEKRGKGRDSAPSYC